MIMFACRVKPAKGKNSLLRTEARLNDFPEIVNECEGVERGASQNQLQNPMAFYWVYTVQLENQNKLLDVRHLNCGIPILLQSMGCEQTQFKSVTAYTPKHYGYALYPSSFRLGSKLNFSECVS